MISFIFSAYCGNLNIAALRACVEMSKRMNDKTSEEEYNAWLEQAKTSYSNKLWNGKYYNYDSSTSRYHDCIMSDQLAGFWYLRLSGHKYEVKFLSMKNKRILILFVIGL